MKKSHRVTILVIFAILLLIATQIKATSHPVGGCYQTDMGQLCVDGIEYGVNFGWPVVLLTVSGNVAIYLSAMIIRLVAYILLLLVPIIFVVILLITRSIQKNHRR